MRGGLSLSRVQYFRSKRGKMERQDKAAADAGDRLTVLDSEIRAYLERPNLAEGDRKRCTRWLSLIEPLRLAMTAGGSLTDITDLPPELLKELNIPSDGLETQIIGVLEMSAAAVDLDQILIGLYRRFGVVQKRRFLQNKLWRMVKKQQIYKLKDRRGLYALDPGRAAKKASRAKRAGRKK